MERKNVKNDLVESGTKHRDKIRVFRPQHKNSGIGALLASVKTNTNEKPTNKTVEQAHPHQQSQKSHPIKSRNDHHKRGRGFSSDKNRRNRPRPIMIKDIPVNIPPAGDSIRIIPLGGVEEIGRNMTLIEYKDDIIVVDAGFQFKDENTPGIDYILPNTKYLEERKDKIRAVFITHGHLDHIGGIPYIMPRIGNPPIYSRLLTTLMMKKRQEEFPYLPALDIRTVEKDEVITAGKLKIRFFAVTHTIPDSMGIIIETPHGWVVAAGDLKLDHDGKEVSQREQKEFQIFKDKKVLFLMMDSTNVDIPGFSTPESIVLKNLEEIIKSINGRLIVGTFSSQIERMITIIKAAENCGKKVVIEGRSMKNNIEIIKQAKILEVKPGTIVPVESMHQYPQERIVALVTGSQGDEYAALMRMAVKSHKYFKVTKGDTVLLSSSIIPGNERAVQKLKDNLARQGAKIMHYRSSDIFIHSSGHGNKGELEWIHKQINTKFFMPVHGSHYMLRVHSDLAQSLGIPEKNIVVPDNGTIVEISDNGEKLSVLEQKAPSNQVMVDGFSVGDIQEVVIRDRQMLSEDGMFIVFAVVDEKTGKLRRSPDIISRGFVYLRESQDLLYQTRIIIKKTIEKAIAKMNPINYDFAKTAITDEVEKFLYQETAKRPIVIPVIFSV